MQSPRFLSRRVLVPVLALGLLLPSAGFAEPASPCGKDPCSTGACKGTRVTADAVQPPKGVGVLTTQALAILVRTHTPMALFDARPPDHDDGRRIPGATVLLASASASEVARQIKTKDSLVVVYCANPQCAGYARLAARLLELGYANVLASPEGIDGWAAAGLAFDRPDKAR